MKHIYHSKNAEATYHLGELIGRSLIGNETVLLLGDMGSGKTAITKGIVAGMGFKDDVSSPTYTLVNEYREGNGVIYHFDLYRLHTPDELYDMGFEDYLNDEALLILEWPQLTEDFPFSNVIQINLKVDTQDYDQREIVIESDNPEFSDKISQELKHV